MGINDQSVWKYIRERSFSDLARLSKTAVIDCTREYTYAQMFGAWERYARVFSALGMTEENAARVGIAGTISAEPLFAFYGLNMTGASVSMLSYPDFLPGGQWRAMVEREKLTDLVLSDIMLTPDMWPEIEKAKAELGLRNVIFLHSRLGGPCAGPAELVYDEVNYHTLKKLPGTVFMEELLRQYAAAPVHYGSGDPSHLAIITHTSGTTKGTRKPLPYTERAVNTVATNFGPGFHAYAKDAPGQLRLAPSFDFSSFLCMCGLVNSSFAVGDTVVLTFFGFMHPKFVRAVSYYRLDVIFTSGFMIDSWMKRSDTEDIDFSSVKIFSCGGSYLPPDKLVKYTEFARAHGYKGHIQRGYGMSETGGAQLMVPEGCMDDILGFPTPKENFLIQDENDGKFYTADAGVRTGVMYVASDSLCMNELDGEVLFEYTKIDGRDFICTNDLVRVNPDGSFSYAGRADRFFVNNDGARFNAGAVETEIAKQPAVVKCAVVPVFDKRIHDTVPALYIVPERPGGGAAETARKALVNAYIAKGALETDILPSQLILVDDIPCNANGKIDIYKITRDRLHGEAWNIVPLRKAGRLADILVEPAGQADSITAGTLPKGMEGRSALGIYELFNTQPEEKRRGLFPSSFGMYRSMRREWGARYKKSRYK
jgi:acyl-coenzyme A synthetase/AMP-(fatty) acid ligase